MSGEGSLESYQTKGGEDRTDFKLNCRDVSFHGRADDTQAKPATSGFRSSDAPAAAPAAQTAAPTQPSLVDDNFEEDDIPF